MTNSPHLSGYVADTIYPHKVHQELCPAWLTYAAAINQSGGPNLAQAFNYLELGCGTGASIIANARAFPAAQFYALDANADHIAVGRRLAREHKVNNLSLEQMTFDDFLQDNTQSFEFIALHGVYSWVNQQDRQAIRQIIDRFLTKGGLVFLSYNCLPGWANEAPLRKLLVELTAELQGSAAEKAGQAINAVELLSTSNMRYFQANPALAQAIASYKDKPAEYIAHEFLNEAWKPFYSVDVADEFCELGCSLVGSATLVDNYQPLWLDDRQAALIRALPSERLQQTVADFAANRAFRRDIFSRQIKTLTQSESEKLVDATFVESVQPSGKIPTKVRIPRGELSFQDAFTVHLQQLLSRGPHAIGTLVKNLAANGQDRHAIKRNLSYLIAAGVIAPSPLLRDVT